MADWDGLRHGLEDSVVAPPLSALRARRRQRQQRRTIALASAVAMVGTASGVALLGRAAERGAQPPQLAARPTGNSSDTVVNGGRTVPSGDHAAHVVTDVDFVSPATGWAIGVRCVGTECDVATFRTTDGGRTWGPATDVARRVPRSSFHEEDPRGGAVRSIKMVDELRGYAFNPDLYRTSDGGRTWQRDPRPSKATSVSAVGDNVWVTERGCPRDADCDLGVRSGPVGGRLADLDVPETNGALAIVRRQGARTGYLLTWDGPEEPRAALHATHDEGRTWERRTHPCPDATAASLSAGVGRPTWLVCTTPAGRRAFISSDAGANWTPAGSPPADGEVTDLVAWTGEDAYLTLQNPGRLLVTHDRGRTWQRATGTAPAYGYANLDVVSATHAFAMGDEGQLWRTTDGERWERLALPPALPRAAPPATRAPSDAGVTFRALSFLDRTRGFALGERCDRTTCRAVLRRTSDGGLTWQPAGAPRETWPAEDLASWENRVASVTFADARNGWLFGPTLFATRDGGATWSKASAGQVYDVVPRRDVWWTVEYEGCAGTPCGPRIGRGRVGDARARWGGGYETDPRPGTFAAPTDTHAYFVEPGPVDPDGIHAPNLLATRDGGRTWTTYSAPCDDADRRQVSAYAPDGLWVVCSEFTDGSLSLATSADGGATWRSAPLPGREAPGELRPLSPTDAWRAGGRSGLYVTRDGGRTWAAAPEVRTRLFSLTFADARHGWALDGSGHVWRTTDGRTWTRTTRP